MSVQHTHTHTHKEMRIDNSYIEKEKSMNLKRVWFVRFECGQKLHMPQDRCLCLKYVLNSSVVELTIALTKISFLMDINVNCEALLQITDRKVGTEIQLVHSFSPYASRAVC